MRKTLAILATALSLAATGLSPAGAMPFPAAAPATADTLPVVKAQVLFRDREDPRYRLHRWGNDRPDLRRIPPRARPAERSGYMNGYRGYRDHRPGYRYHDGFWFPLAAFAAGAITGGAIQQARPITPDRVRPGRYSPRHYAWCEQRYKTYRASDNTYVANSRGERRVCNSPY
ncbi:BA14K family protein [Rhizobium sp. CSW-27]|uniref:BA14K family protein n=1 Tax=Rhizobium sp. CSW-27 TaxID=2839985 RepID=UPI001C00F44D|nr:BA14K family protein [Rhizobium sp. CSW-27]MBT9368848.1 BA14K family protein [Rhizobium sp. CSW-27]